MELEGISTPATAPTDTTRVATAQNQLPEVLNRLDIIAVLNNAVESGYLDKDYQLTPKMNKTKAAMLVTIMKNRLELGKAYATFERFWGVTNLSQKEYKACGTKKYHRVKSELEKLFI